MLSPPTHPRASPALDDLLRERAAIHPIRSAVPHLWALLDAQIARHLDPARPPPSPAPIALSTSTSSSTSTDDPADEASSADSSSATPAARPAAAAPQHAQQHALHHHHAAASHHHAQHQPTLMRANTAPLPPLKRPSVAPRRRIKIPVPADKYPDYNFVGRLLGPRGTTLKTLERDTRCKIMIRGKGSIRKDKEPDVRGKPGWEHVFNEPLHVVIELADHLDDPSATQALNRARDAVEFLLVPVPEERDALKRQQLRALAIMNGTYRGAPARSMDHLPIPSYAPAPQSHHHAAPSPSHSMSSFADHLRSAPFMHDASHAMQSSFDALSTQDDILSHASSRPVAPAAGPHTSHPNLAFGSDFAFDRLRQHQRSKNGPAPTGRRSPPSGATSPNSRLAAQGRAQIGVPHELSALTASFQRCGVDDLMTSSVEDTPESSRSSDDGTCPSVPNAGSTDGHLGANFCPVPTASAPPPTHVKVSSISPPTRPDPSLGVGVGGFIGREFYNGAFSNQSQSLSCQSPWDRPHVCSPAPPHSPSAAALSSSMYAHNNSPAPSTEVLTSSMSTVTPIERHYDGY